MFAERKYTTLKPFETEPNKRRNPGPKFILIFKFEIVREKNHNSQDEIVDQIPEQQIQRQRKTKRQSHR